MTDPGVHLEGWSFPPMRFRTLPIALLLLATGVAVVDAQTKYWDIDILNVAGAGSTTPTGVWNTTSHNWNTDSTGLGIPNTWTPGNTAVFAAGTNATGSYTVTVTGTQSLSGLTVEEGMITQNSGTLDFGSTFNASINIASGAGWGETSTGVIKGTDGIVNNGAGLLSLRGLNTFTRAGSGNQAFLTINAGIVDFVADANLGAVPSATNNATALTLNGGTLRYSNTITSFLAPNRGIFIGANGGTFEITNQVTLALPVGAPATAALSGSGTITKTGQGRLRLQTAQTTFTGKYVVKAGSLVFPSEDRLGAVPATTQADYFTLDGGGLYGDLATGATINAKRGITLGASGGYLAFSGTGLSYDGIIAGTQGGALSLTTTDVMGTATAGTISLNSANTYNGPTLIANGITLAVALLANGGTNSAIGSSANTASNLVLDGGTLQYVGAATSTDRNFTITATGGYIDASGASNAPLTFTNTAPIGLDGTGPHTLVLRGTSTGDNIFSQAITNAAAGATQVNKLDPGTWVLKNTANSYTGDTIISLGGRLKLGASGVIPDASVIQLYSSGVFDLNGYDETVRSINTLHPPNVNDTSGTIALGTKSLTINNPNGESYTAAITGTGGGRIIKNGAGKFTLSPTTATYDGGLTLNGGTLGVGTNSALGTGTLVVNNNPTLAAPSSAAVSFTNAVTLNGNLTINDSFVTNPGSITWGASGANKWTITGGERIITVHTIAGGYGVTINQPIAEDVAGRGFMKMGNGTLTLTGANTYTGNTSVGEGTLSISSPYFADSAAVLLNSAAKLNLNFAAGVVDTVDAFFVDGIYQPLGTWGAIGSGADHESALFTGAGKLNVIPYQPPVSSTPLAGDFNNDGKVDAGDYITWRKANGTNNALLNDNGLGTPIGQAHLDLWRQNFGTTRGPGSGTGSSDLNSGTIPEPSAMMLVIFGIAGLTSAMPRRQRHK
jgi:fibronectin-binding autotransporter adhesin